MTKKRFLDPTLLLRSVESNDPERKAAVVRLLNTAARNEIDLITNLTAITEPAFLLDRDVDNGVRTRQTVRSTITTILDTVFIEAVDMHIIIPAMHLYATTTIKLGDAFIAAWMREHNVDTLQTFEHHFNQIEWLTAKNPERPPLTPPRRQFADTNIFLGAIQPSSPERQSAIIELFRAGSIDQIQLITNETVIMEMVYIMQFGWKLDRATIRKNLLAIINDPMIEVADEGIIVRALRLYETLGIKIDKALIAEWMLENDIDTIYTFDADYGRIPTITAFTPQ